MLVTQGFISHKADLHVSLAPLGLPTAENEKNNKYMAANLAM